MHIHEYETTFIFRPDLDEAEHERIKQRLMDTISNNSGEILVLEDWGRRKLAYKIKKQHSGHYLFVNYASPAGVPAQIERVVKIEDNVVRFLTVKINDFIEIENTRVLARQRQRRRIARAQAASNAAAAMDDSRGRVRNVRESMMSPAPIAPPTGTAMDANVADLPDEEIEDYNDDDNDQD